MAWGLGVFSDEPKLCWHDPGAGSSTGGTGRVGSWERHVGAVLLVCLWEEKRAHHLIGF